MSRSQDSNTPLLSGGVGGSGMRAGGSLAFGGLKSGDLSYSRSESLSKQQKVPLIGSEGSPNSGSSPATTPVTSSMGSHISSPVQYSSYHTPKNRVSQKMPRIYISFGIFQ